MDTAFSIEDSLNNAVTRKSKYLFFCKVKIHPFKIKNKVMLKCFHCRNYKNKWTCPPNIPQINYKDLFNEYENAAIVYCKMPFSSKEEFNVVRIESTNLLHRTLLELEADLYENNVPLAISFMGGSCKLCKDGCSKEGCRHPDLSRIPLEATGVDVIDFVKETIGINILFPPKDYLYRVGLLLW